MNSRDVANILRTVGVSVEDTPVSSEALGLPGGVRVRRLVDVITTHQDDGDYGELVTALQVFTERYELLADQPSRNGSEGESEVTEDEVELVAYLDLG